MVEGVAVVVVDILRKAVAHIDALGSEEFPVAIKRAAAEEADDLQVLRLDLGLLLSLLVSLINHVKRSDALQRRGHIHLGAGKIIGANALRSIAIVALDAICYAAVGSNIDRILFSGAVAFAALEEAHNVQALSLRLLLGLILGHVVNINRRYAL